MTLLVPALGGALMVAGIIGLFAGLQKTPVKPAAPRSNTRFALPRLSLSSRCGVPQRRIAVDTTCTAALAVSPSATSVANALRVWSSMT